MIINVSFDQAESTLPAGFVACVNAACAYYETMFTNNVTLNISVGYGEVGGVPIFGDAGESHSSYSSNLSYSQVVSALTVLQAPGSSTLASTSPITGSLALTTAEQKALGLISPTATASDGAMGFSPPLLGNFFYDPSHTLAVPTGDTDFMAVFEHELSELMGRVSTLGQTGGLYSPLDLYRYSAPGTLQTTAGGAGYFSTDGGVTGSAAAFNTVVGGDFGDWATSVAGDAFDEAVANGTNYSVTATDFKVMQALGWTGSYQTDSQVTLPATASAATAAFQGGATRPVAVVDSAAHVLASLDSLAAMAAANSLASITLTDGSPPTPLSVTAAQFTADSAAIKLITDNYALTVTGVTAANASTTAAQAIAVTGSNISNDGNTVSIAVSDTAAHIAANLSELQSINDQLSSITITDNASLTVTASVYQTDMRALRTLTNGSLLTVTNVTVADLNLINGFVFPRGAIIEVADSAANVAAALGNIEGWMVINPIQITLTDGGTPTLNISDTDWDSHAAALGAIQGNFKVAISSVKVSDLSSMTGNSQVAAIAVSDTAANVSAALDTLESLATSHILTGITLTDAGTPTLTVTAAQQSADATALALITSAHSVSVTATPMTAAAALAALSSNPATSVAIVDTAANISANFDALQAALATGKLASISDPTGGTLILTEAQLTSDAQLLSSLTGDYNVVVTAVKAADVATIYAQHPTYGVASVSDTAANVAANLDTLTTLFESNRLASIAITDQNSTVTISAAQLAQDGSIFPWISGFYTIDVSTPITTDQLNELVGFGRVGHVSIADTAANVTANFNLLEGFSGAGNVTSITITDGGSIAIDVDRYLGGLQFINQINGSHTLSVSAVPLDEISTVLHGADVASITVADQASAISASLDTLQADVAAGKVTGINLTDGGTATLTVTAAQLVSDAQAINSITGNYTLSVTDASLASLSANILAHASAISVSDSAANISSDLDTLQSLAAAGKLISVAVTDTDFPSLSVTAAQLTSDSSVLSDLTGGFTVKIDASSSANLTLSGVAGHGNTVSFADTASDYSISAAASGDTVTVTDTGTGRTSTDTLSGVTALQFGSQTDIVAQTPGQGQVTTGNVTELYGAVFGRLPDVAGLQFYENVLAQAPNTPLTTFAQWFLASPEYTGNSAHDYAQSSAGDAQFITDCYQNLLGRAPESGAIPYYENVINSFTQGLTAGTSAYAAAQTLGHAYVLSYFSASPEFLGDVTITAQNPSSTQHWLLLTNG